MNDAGRICFVLKGDYDTNVQYDFLDVVQFGNATYAAKKNTLGNQPEDGSEYWQLIAKGIEIRRVNALPETDIDASVIYALMDKNGEKAALYQYNDSDNVWVQYGGTGDADFIEITHDAYESLPPEEKADGKARFVYNVPNTGQVIMLNNKKYSGTDFTGTKEEFEAALAAGKIEPGTIVNITDDYQEGGITVDSELSETSENPVQNKVTTQALQGKIGVEKIANNSIVTEPGFVADAIQLNKEVEGSYAKGVNDAISLINQSLSRITNAFKGRLNFNGGDILDAVLSGTSGDNSCSLYLVVTGSGTTNVPIDFTYSVGLVLNRYASGKVVILFNVNMRADASKIAFNSYDTTKWLGWKVL